MNNLLLIRCPTYLSRIFKFGFINPGCTTRNILFSLIKLRHYEIGKLLLNKYKRNNYKRSNKWNAKGKLLCGAALLAFSEDKITEDEIKHYFDEFKSDQNSDVVNEDYCSGKNEEMNVVNEDCCKNNKEMNVNKMPQSSSNAFVDSSWEKMLDSKIVKMWRRPRKDKNGLYEYRVCGSFDDITARGFLTVQTDLDYRKDWDSFVVQLDSLGFDEDTENETIRWITHYPVPLKNREYIYKRRVVENPERGDALIVSRTVPLDQITNISNSNGYVRISNYQSIMYIRCHVEYDKPGLDYFLIYYDDPETKFPSTATNWISCSGIPNFMKQVHQATLRLESLDEVDKRYENLAHRLNKKALIYQEPLSEDDECNSVTDIDNDGESTSTVKSNNANVLSTVAILFREIIRSTVDLTPLSSVFFGEPIKLFIQNDNNSSNKTSSRY